MKKTDEKQSLEESDRKWEEFLEQLDSPKRVKMNDNNAFEFLEVNTPNSLPIEDEHANFRNKSGRRRNSTKKIKADNYKH